TLAQLPAALPHDKKLQELLDAGMLSGLESSQPALDEVRRLIDSGEWTTVADLMRATGDQKLPDLASTAEVGRAKKIQREAAEARAATAQSVYDYAENVQKNFDALSPLIKRPQDQKVVNDLSKLAGVVMLGAKAATSSWMILPAFSAGIQFLNGLHG